MHIKQLLVGLALALMLCGCANRYKMTLSNGNVMTTTTKPKLNKEAGTYEFKDSQGRPGRVPSFRVREIEPL